MKPKPYILLPYYYPLSDPEGDKDYRVPHTKQKRKLRSSQDISIDAKSKMRTIIKISPHDVINLRMWSFMIWKLNSVSKGLKYKSVDLSKQGLSFLTIS